MINLTSKIQYKTYEKGEFDAEQERSLEDTLSLIKAFPWDTQRGVDVQASGPGIVIHGPANDYLKVAIYYNGKFTVYYLDPENHLYEFHTPDLDIADQKVADYFNGTLSLDDFEKHFFNIGNRNHFITRSFDYSISFSRAMAIPLIFGIYLSIPLLVAFHQQIGTELIILISAAVIVYIISQTIYNKYQYYYLKISKGHDEFVFATNLDDERTYNKQDIKEVVIYQTSRRRVYGQHNKWVIFFTDGTILRVPAMLIPATTFMSKFRYEIVHIEYLNGWNSFGGTKY